MSEANLFLVAENGGYVNRGAVEILRDLSARGFELSLEWRGHGITWINCAQRHQLTPEDIAAIEAHRVDLVLLLRAEQSALWIH